jgi:hypothetical protein
MRRHLNVGYGNEMDIVRVRSFKRTFNCLKSLVIISLPKCPHLSSHPPLMTKYFLLCLFRVYVVGRIPDFLALQPSIPHRIYRAALCLPTRMVVSNDIMQRKHKKGTFCPCQEGGEEGSSQRMFYEAYFLPDTRVKVNIRIIYFHFTYHHHHQHDINRLFHSNSHHH